MFIVNDGEFRFAALEQRQRIDDETRNDVQLDFRPERPVGIHGGHQPIEAIVTLHCDTQWSRTALRQSGDVPARTGHLRKDFLCQAQEPLADRGEPQRPDIFFDEAGAVMTFQRLQLMRQCRLREKQPIRGFGEISALSKRQKRLQVPQFQCAACHNEIVSYPSKRSTAFLELLQRRLVILDGAMGTMIQRRADLPRHGYDNLDALSLTQPHIVADIHRQYLEAGADVICTNTFNGTTVSQAEHGLAPLVSEMNETSARLARTVADHAFAATGIPRFVAGVMGPTSLSLSRSPDRVEEVTAAYAQACRALIEGGVDVLLIETVVDIVNARAALWAARRVMYEGNVDLPLIVSTVIDEAGQTASGHTPQGFWHAIRDARPAMAGFNCVFPGPHLRRPLEQLARSAQSPVCLYPSAGLPDAAGHYAQPPDRIADLLCGLARDGLLNMIGGCCGTTPDHIRVMAEAVAGIPPRAYHGAGL